MILQN